MELLRVLLILLFVSCAKETDELGFRTYIIPEGEHSSGTFINHPDNSRIIFDFILDESAIYYTEVPENQHDVNKIYGMSDFGKLHQKYSIRLGWRYIDGKIELCWLRHEDGRHSSETIRTIEPNEIYNASNEFKIYGFQWTNEIMKWYIDGALVHVKNSGSEIPLSDWPNKKMCLVINNGLMSAVAEEDTIFRNSLIIDYIKIFQKDD